MILDNIEETGQNIRKWYQRKLPSNPNRDYYYIIRNTSPAESILVEYAFLDSTKDDRKQIKNDWEKWAEAVVKAVADYKGYNYTAPGANTVNDTYTVARGDSLWSIAKRFNVGVNEIKNANNLKSNLISVGQQLIIPGAAPSDQTNVTYVVQKGDTLYSIALKYGTTPNEIIRKNNLKNNTLTVGQTLTIPNDVESTGDYSDMSNSNAYVVQRGDSLYSIANAYNVSVNDLRNINNLTSDILSVGQVLIIPGNSNRNSNTSNLYVVKRGDSLWSIANKFNVSINKIRMLNNLNSDILTIGQTLIIS